MTDWEGILRRDGPAVWRCACRLLGRADEAEECFQETFVAAMEAFARGGEGSVPAVRSERALLLRIATARAMDRPRARYRRRSREVSAEWAGLPDPGPRPPEAAEAAELSARLRAALATLPARQADAFCLHCLEGWSYQAIAGQMRVSIDAVGVLLHRARAGLRKRLRAIEPGAVRSPRNADAAPGPRPAPLPGPAREQS
jgi:RNA polymerase sigma-70 factor, ECF subfamily